MLILASVDRSDAAGSLDKLATVVSLSTVVILTSSTVVYKADCALMGRIESHLREASVQLGQRVTKTETSTFDAVETALMIWHSCVFCAFRAGAILSRISIACGTVVPFAASPLFLTKCSDLLNLAILCWLYNAIGDHNI
jgi:hypothetical protein